MGVGTVGPVPLVERMDPRRHVPDPLHPRLGAPCVGGVFVNVGSGGCAWQDACVEKKLGDGTRKCDTVPPREPIREASRRPCLRMHTY